MSDLQTLITELGGPADSTAEPLEQLAGLIDESLPYERLWLVWATLRGRLPTDEDVISFRRNARLNGVGVALRDLERRDDSSVFGRAANVEILSGAVLIDVSHTSSTDYTSGIQRVVRETVGRWSRDHDIVLVAWNENGTALRLLDDVEEERIRGALTPGSGRDRENHGSTIDAVASARVVVPRGGRLINPELALDGPRAARLSAIARFSDVEVSYIGYDCVPLTSGETASEGVAQEFPLYLDAIGDADKVAAISKSTEFEFASWKRMLAASGRRGPDLRTFFLGGDSAEPSADDLARTADDLASVGDAPIILVVGSHEPRKNHLSVLQAARVLWEEGESFRLVFIGSGSWRSEAFFQLADALRARGHSIITRSGASDGFLSASYRLAAVSVFTSLHEGFGLPIVESLRAGTPVITSGLSSMQEVADEYDGVFTVDPHSDEELEDLLRRMLHDPAILETARRGLAGNTYRSWEDYAAEVWQYFTS